MDVQKFYDYYTETGWMTKNQQPITNWKNTLLYWNQSDGTPHKKTKQDEPRSENAEIYESLIGRGDSLNATKINHPTRTFPAPAEK